MPVSKAQMKAVKKYEKKNYERCTIDFPKGTKNRIIASGKSFNGYINEAVKEKLGRDGL